MEVLPAGTALGRATPRWLVGGVISQHLAGSQLFLLRCKPRGGGCYTTSTLKKIFEKKLQKSNKKHKRNARESYFAYFLKFRKNMFSFFPSLSYPPCMEAHN